MTTYWMNTSKQVSVMKALVAYATVEGHTEDIANYIAGKLNDLGYEASAISVESPDCQIQKNQLLVLCAPIHVGRYPASMIEFIKHNKAELSSLSAAFVSVSLGIASESELDKEKARSMIKQISESTGWSPDVVHHSAGAIKYTKYGFIKSRIMRFITKQQGGPVDIHFDHDMTNWDELDEFLKNLATPA